MKASIISEGQFSILRVGEALTCWQAVLILTITAFVGMLFLSLGAVLADVAEIFMLLTTLLAAIIFMAGFNGAGICLNDLTNHKPSRGLVGYLIAGLIYVPKWLGAVLFLVLASFVAFVAVALIFLICKLPGIGPLLLVAGVPVSILIVFMTLLGAYVAASIIAPAIWDGEKLLHAISITWQIVKRYPFAALGKILLGLVLCAIFSAIVIGLTIVSSLLIAGIGGSIIGDNIVANIANIFYMLGMHGFRLEGYLAGAIIGFSLTYGAIAALLTLPPLMVGILTWQEFSKKIDLEAIRAQTSAALEQAQNKFEEIKEKAVTQAKQAATPPTQTTDSNTNSQQNSKHCPQCNGIVYDGDRFCEHCGHKLIST